MVAVAVEFSQRGEVLYAFEEGDSFLVAVDLGNGCGLVDGDILVAVLVEVSDEVGLEVGVGDVDVVVAPSSL